VADIKRVGEDLTIIATSSMVQEALKAADQLDADGVHAEVIDPRTLVPLDKETLVRSAIKTGRVIVVDEGYRSYGVTSELATTILEQAFYYLICPIVRIGALDVPVPFSKPLEDATIPSASQIVAAAKHLVNEKA